MRSLVSRRDESLHDVLGDLETILRLKVLREHRAREIDRQHDVDAFARHVLGVRAGARTRQRDDRRREQQVAQHEQRRASSRGRRAGPPPARRRARTRSPAVAACDESATRSGSSSRSASTQADANWIVPSAITRPPPAPAARRDALCSSRRSARASRPISRARSRAHRPPRELDRGRPRSARASVDLPARSAARAPRAAAPCS